jgi:hypothetical protein
MTLRRLALLVMVANCGFALASCSGVSGYVSDRYPHWAGGEPHDVPPRPGAPGYDDFISHKGADSETARQDYANTKAARQANPQGGPQPSTAPAASAAPPADDDAVARGGLY